MIYTHKWILITIMCGCACSCMGQSKLSEGEVNELIEENRRLRKDNMDLSKEIRAVQSHAQKLFQDLMRMQAR